MDVNDAELEPFITQEQLGGSVRPISKVIPLFRISDPRVRSKLARMVGRYLGYKSFVDKRLEDEDPRVRANAVESFLGREANLVRPLLRRAMDDKNHRVRTNALLGLYMMGEPGVTEVLVQQAAHRLPAFRAAAAWAMGETKKVEFQEILTTLSTDEDVAVRRRAEASLSKIASAKSDLPAQDNQPL